MYHNNNRLQFKIHHKHQHSQFLQLVQMVILLQPDGISIHRFVSVIHIVCISNICINSIDWFLKIMFSYIRHQTAPPTYAESEYRANIVDKNDSQHTRLVGDQNEFAPRYPVYMAQALPTLPNTQNNWTVACASIRNNTIFFLSNKKILIPRLEHGNLSRKKMIIIINAHTEHNW